MQNVLRDKKFHISISRIAFYVGISSFFVLILLRNLLKIDLPSIAFLLVASLIAFFGKKTEIIALCICSIPLGGAYQFKYAIFICIIVYLIKYHRSIRITWALIPLVLMLVWELLHAIGQTFDFIEFFRGFAEIFLCTILFLSDEEVEYAFIVRALAVCTVFIMSIMILNLLIQNNFSFISIFEGTYRFGASDKEMDKFGLNYNANVIGFMCNLSITCLLQRIAIRENKKTDFILITALVIFGVMSMSRTFLLLFLFILAVFLVVRPKTMVNKIKNLLVLIFTVGALYLLVSLIMPSIVERFHERFLEEDITGGRSFLFEFYGRHVFSRVKYVLFGIGMQNTLPKIVSIYGSFAPEFVPHNGIIQLLVFWGLPGLIFFSLFVCALISTAKRRNKLSLVGFLPLIVVFIDIQAVQLFTSNALLALAVSFLSLCNIKKK